MKNRAFAHFETKETFEYEDPIKLNHRQISDYRRWILIRHNEIRCKSEETSRCKIALRFSDEVRYLHQTLENTKIIVAFQINKKAQELSDKILQEKGFRKKNITEFHPLEMVEEELEKISDFENIVNEISTFGVGVSQGKSGNTIMVVSYQL